MLFGLHTSWILLGALALEGAVGYPAWIWRSIGHPVSWMGRFLSFGEAWLNSHSRHPRRDFLSGMVWLAGGITLLGAMTWTLSATLGHVAHGWMVELLIIATLVASRSLHTHVRDVQSALSCNNIADARQKVSLIVGRNTDALEAPAIARAAVESLAENASDGVIAPLFWGLVAGLPGIAVYKLVNTADSMWGHRSDRYEWFGKAAARLDDFLNLVPARLTGILFCLSAGSLRRSRAAFRVMSRDASKHLSPNAGWPEAAVAGALDCRLGGPRMYQAGITQGVWLGDGSEDLEASDLDRSLKLYLTMLGMIAAMIFVIALVGGAPI
ncbi:adenosylcobinamide-phosphate synthase CbiB [Parvibaculaceae bacterium PLY_AMNH_Bact1]|nr:adenosylcobinamide-phosphate synthase CbiB [Parvibaculaceae bacterium PLY_AMNH_Bact1]